MKTKKSIANKMLVILSPINVVLLLFTQQAYATEQQHAVAALGRIEPENGVITLAAPARPGSVSGAVVRELLIKAGDTVVAGQLLATLDTLATSAALIIETEKEIELAIRQSDAANSVADAACVEASTAKNRALRLQQLLTKGLAAEENVEQSQGEADSKMASCHSAKVTGKATEMAIEVALARLERRKAEYERSQVFAPFAGSVLKINTHPGEVVSFGGILELAEVKNMYAIAEVYETDIRRVKVGQKAMISSAALLKPVSGKVVFIHPKIQKHDAIGTDPAARKDARIIEVDILLDDPEPVRTLTYLQVDVLINK